MSAKKNPLFLVHFIIENSIVKIPGAIGVVADGMIRFKIASTTFVKS